MTEEVIVTEGTEVEETEVEETEVEATDAVDAPEATEEVAA